MTASYEVEADATCSLSLSIRVSTNSLEDLSKAVVMLAEDAVESFGKYISDENHMFTYDGFEDNAEEYQLADYSNNVYDVIINDTVIIYCIINVEAPNKRKAVTLSKQVISTKLRRNFSWSEDGAISIEVDLKGIEVLDSYILR